MDSSLITLSTHLKRKSYFFRITKQDPLEDNTIITLNLGSDNNLNLIT